MKKCNRCGEQLDNSVRFCTTCGSTDLSNDDKIEIYVENEKQNPTEYKNNKNYNSNNYNKNDNYYDGYRPYHQEEYQTSKKDTGSFGWCILSFFFPIVGLVLFIVWNKEKPKTAAKCLAGFIAGGVFMLGFNLCAGIIQFFIK